MDEQRETSVLVGDQMVISEKAETRVAVNLCFQIELLYRGRKYLANNPDNRQCRTMSITPTLQSILTSDVEKHK